MVKITILGSGTAVSSFYKPFDFRYPSGYLLQYKDKNYLIDCSEGIRQRLEHIKVDYFDIDTVFISHFHPDHFNVETLIQSQMVRNYFAKTKKTLTIYGPPELEKRLETIWDAKHNAGHFKKNLPEFLEVKTIEYKDKEKILINDFVLIPYKISHGNMPAYALRFEINKKILTYSGDTNLCPEIVDASKQSDLFICEAFEKVGIINKNHLNPQQIGEIGIKNVIKEIVLTHLTNSQTDDQLVKGVKETGFTGKITVASDFLTIGL